MLAQGQNVKGEEMTRIGDSCEFCASTGTMRKLQRNDFRTRLLRLIIPCEQVRCDMCGRKAWVSEGTWFRGRPAGIPPVLFLALCIVLLIVAYCIGR